MAIRLALVSLLAVLPAAGRADDSMRCPRGIVAVGDLTVDLLGKCGPPSLRERRDEDRALVAATAVQGVATAERLTSAVEQWTYDFGKSRFLQLVTLRNGRIERIEQGGYGYGLPAAAEPGPPRVSSCDLSTLHPGDTKADALARCGPPASSTSWRAPRSTVPVVRAGQPLAEPAMTAEVEQWVYNLGPNQFLRVLTFEDGRVVRIETGGYGYPE